MVALTKKSPNNKKRKSISNDNSTPDAESLTLKTAKLDKKLKSPASATPKQHSQTPKGKSKQNSASKQTGTNKNEEESEGEEKAVDITTTEKETPQKKKGDFFELQERLANGDTVGALEEINAKIEVIEAREVKSKTAKRKIALLQRLKLTAEGKPSNSKMLEPKAGKKKQQKKKQVKESDEKEAEDFEEKIDKKEESAEEDIDKEASGSGEDDNNAEIGEEEEDAEDKKEEEGEPKAKKAKIQNERHGFIPVKESFTTFVTQLTLDTTEAQLRELFNQCGNIKTVTIPRHKGSCEARGYAFIEFENDESVKKSLPLNGSILNAREIVVRSFNPREEQNKLDVFINNVDSNATDEQIKAIFNECGKMQYVKRLINPKTQKPRNFAFIRFEQLGNVKKALALNGAELNGRELNVRRVEPRHAKGPPKKPFVKGGQPSFKPGQKRNFGGKPTGPYKPKQFGRKPS